VLSNVLDEFSLVHRYSLSMRCGVS
jgi:hypothetical protein